VCVCVCVRNIAILSVYVGLTFFVHFREYVCVHIHSYINIHILRVNMRACVCIYIYMYLYKGTMYATTLKVAVEITRVCLCAGERAKEQMRNKSTPRKRRREKSMTRFAKRVCV